MTNEEIVREYREAKTPLKQISILADENQCSRGKIVEILREAGVELPAVYREKNAGTAAAGDPHQSAALTASPRGSQGAGEHPAEETEEAPEADYGPILPAPRLVGFAERVNDGVIEVIAKMMKDCDTAVDQDSATWEFRERVRGVLALAHELRGGYGG